jgi:membrane associated rhomboid family serine protease
MLVPLRHENMRSRRWPVITIGLIALNVLVFLGTHWRMDQGSHEFAAVRAHILMLAAFHPDLRMPPEVEKFVVDFSEHNPRLWQQTKSQYRALEDSWDARMRLMEPQQAQAEMDSLGTQYLGLKSASILERYAFIPAHPTAISYLTHMFLHGGWMHIIFNMWFLWLAGIILEDTWGRVLYPIFYLVAGVAACLFHAWIHSGSMAPMMGASGAVAGLMGAFLARYPNTKIEMAFVFFLRMKAYHFKAPAYALLPLWALTEVFYGTLFGTSSGVAHWSHVGGFAFGAIAALGLSKSGIEQKADQAIESKVSWSAHPDLVEATDFVEKGQLDQALVSLKKTLAEKPDCVEALTLLQQVHWRRSDLPAHHDALAKLAQLHVKNRDLDAAWQDYEEFTNAGGQKFPASAWLELCRHLEAQGHFDRAVSELETLAAAYPAERQSLLALMSAGRISLKKLNRPADAVRFYQAAQVSSFPHLDWDTNIQAGLKEAQERLTGVPVASVRS